MINPITKIIDESWSTIAIFLVVISIIRIAHLKQSNKKFIFYKELFSLIFVAYILLLAELVTYKGMECLNFNLIPFKEIFRYKMGSENFYKQVIGNIVIFIPFGYFAANYIKIFRLRGIFFLTFLVSFVIEGVQYFTGRCFDVDDILLNILGGMLGFLFYISMNAIKKYLPKIFQTEFFYSVISFLLILFIVLYFLGFLKFLGI